jgi:hypothetical protein
MTRAHGTPTPGSVLNDRILACFCLALLFAVACGPDPSNNATDCPEGQVCPDENCSGDPSLDADEDGICDADDPCPNIDEPDSDGDGVCDSTDACEGFPDWFDVDRDGLPAECDTCIDGDQSDADEDGVPDPCDVCAGHDDAADADGDGVPDGCDCDAACPDGDTCSNHPTGALCVCDSGDPEDDEPCIDAAPRVVGPDDIVMSAGRTVEVDLTVIENHIPWTDVTLDATSSDPTVVESIAIQSPDQYCPYARWYEPVSIEGGFGFNENGRRGVDDIRQLDLLFTENFEVRGELSIEHDSIAYFLEPMLICGPPSTGTSGGSDL